MQVTFWRWISFSRLWLILLLLPVSTHFLKFRSLVEEIEGMIYQVEKVLKSSKVLSILSQVDPKKKVEIGSFRISGDGTQEGRKLVSVNLQSFSRLIFQLARSHMRDPMSTCLKWWTLCARTLRIMPRQLLRPVGSQLSSGLAHLTIVTWPFFIAHLSRMILLDHF